MRVRIDFFDTYKGLIRKDGKVISAPVRTREESYFRVCVIFI